MRSSVTLAVGWLTIAAVTLQLYVDLELERRLKELTYNVFSETLNPGQSIRLKVVRILALSRRPRPRISITG